jgi:transcriptional/translational regulatory protein YebC/TACO1
VIINVDITVAIDFNFCGRNQGLLKITVTKLAVELRVSSTAAVAEVRHALSKHGGNLGTEGSVAFQFKHCGQLLLAPGTSEDAVMEAALDAGADDVLVDEDGAVEVLTSPTAFEAVKAALDGAGLSAGMAEVTYRPEVTIELSDDDRLKMQKIIDALEELDDVQEVFHNAAL